MYLVDGTKTKRDVTTWLDEKYNELKQQYMTKAQRE